MKKIFVLSSLILFYTSCSVSRHTVGNGPIGVENPQNNEVFDKSKHVYAVYGLITLKETQLKIPQTGNYQYYSSFNIFDGILSTLTAGLVTTRTEKIIIKKQ
jgi:hypothetical protein